MPFFITLWVLAVLAFGSQVVLSAFTFSFEKVQQCEPVSIKFSHSGISNASLPLSLTILPFTSAQSSSAPILIPIPNAASNTSGVYITFLPLAANTEFIASLDDASGNHVALVSDVIRVGASPTGNTTCIPDTTTEVFYSLNDTFSQCEPFNVTFNTSEITGSPSVRAFVPRLNALHLHRTADEPGLSTYVMEVPRGLQVLLLLDDGSPEHHRQTTTLLTVGGDTSSSIKCFPPKDDNDKQTAPKTPSSPTLSKAAIIGIGVGGGLVVAISVVMVLFVLRERRRRRQKGVAFDPALLSRRWSNEKRDFSPQPSSFNLPPSFTSPSSTPRPGSFGQHPFTATRSNGFVEDPSYAFDDFSEKFGSPSSSYYPKTSISSWAQAVPDDQRYPRSNAVRRSTGARSEISLDIERMLDMAAQPEDNSSGRATPGHLTPATVPMGLPPAHLAASSPTTPVRPSDTPVDPAFMAVSMASSANPFSDKQESALRPLYSSVVPEGGPYAPSAGFDNIQRPPGALVGSPASPTGTRDARSGITRTTIIDNGGIGAFPTRPNPPGRDTIESWGNLGVAG